MYHLGLCKGLKAELDEMKMMEINEEVKDMDNDKITISMEEYKELLMIKGRYEELKGRIIMEIGKKDDGLCKPPYRVTL